MVNIAQQEGTALVITLVILSMLTLFGLSSMSNSILEERSTVNISDSNRSLEATEVALTAGEDWVNTLTELPKLEKRCPTKPCVLQLDPKLDLSAQKNAWWVDNGAGTNNIQGVTSVPRYVVQYLRFVPDDLTVPYGAPQGRHFFRITARGTGKSNNAVTIIQTTFVRRF